MGAAAPRFEARFTDKERDFVFSVAMKYVKDPERADDVAQDAMMLAYQHRASFRGDARFTTWLYRITATTALMHLRKLRRRGLTFSQLDDEAQATLERRDPGPSPEDAWGAHEAVRLAEGHLADMGDKYGEIFALRFIDGYSEQEIAARLSLHVATVKTRAYRARAHVQKALARQIKVPLALAA